MGIEILMRHKVLVLLPWSQDRLSYPRGRINLPAPCEIETFQRSHAVLLILIPFSVSRKGRSKSC